MDLPRTPIDPLGEALHLLRMSGTFYCRSEFTAPWGLELPPFAHSLMFHVITSGDCWLEVAGASPRRLGPGDLALVPHGEGHRLVDRPGAAVAALFDLPRELLSERYERLRHGGGGAATELLCGAMVFDHPAAQRLVSLLPRVLVIEAADNPQADWLRSTIRLIGAEARELRLGGETVITRLADVVVVQAIRHWMASDPAAGTGWLGALKDPQIGRAIALIHRDPAHPWTVESLAAAVAMSRSAFAARFTARVGEPAMHYVTRWRMQLAVSLLRERAISQSELALRLGYQSEAAFSRAFKRAMGAPPGAVRRGIDGHLKR